MVKVNGLNVHFIDSEDELNKWMEKILASPPKLIGADIEANSMYRFHHTICLLQLGLPNDILLVDMQKLRFIDSLAKVLRSPHIIKVFQDMKYDISMFWFEYQCKVEPVFDIAIADRLIRHENEYRSQDKLVKEYLDITQQFSKSVQKSDWGIRPLSQKQIEYAASDVAYLQPLYQEMKHQLDELDLTEYISTYMANIESIQIRRKFNPNSMWKFKGIDRLSKIQLHRLYNLTILRTEIAEVVDRPLHWVIDNRSMVDLMYAKIHKKSDILDFFEKRNRTANLISDFLDQIYSVLTEPIEQVIPHNRPPIGETLKVWLPIEDEHQSIMANIPRAKAIKAWSRLIADEYGILPEMIIQKEELNFCSTLDLTELERELSMPGIPVSKRNEFVLNLINYLETSDFSELQAQ